MSVLDTAVREETGVAQALISLEGYYGRENLGDDILMIVSYSLIREAFGPEEISVLTTGRPYVRGLLGEGCRLRCDYRRPGSVRGVVLGGGGLYHDFRGSGRPGGRVAQLALRLFGVGPIDHARGLKRAASRALGMGGAGTPAHVALGLGLGPFAPGSWFELVSALTLSAFRLIVVRDAESERICRSWGLRGRVVRATDIAFLRDRWLPDGVAAAPAGRPRRGAVAVVVRDWPFHLGEAKYVESLRAAVAELRRRGLAVRYVSFNPEADGRVLGRLSADDEDVLCWRPEAQRLADFLAELAGFDLVVTARAHGAIVAACLGVPSVCVEIEPKLAHVQEMLARSGRSWKPPFRHEDLLAEIGAVFDDYAGVLGRLNDDVEENRDAARLAETEVLRTLRAVKLP